MKKFKQLLHHLFIPKEKNNYRAKALHHDFLTAYLILALIATFFFKQLGDTTGSVLGYATDINIPKLLELTNAERTKDGLTPLTYNDKLAKAAQEKANDMFAKNYWAHYGPGNETPWQFILSNGYDYEFAGENLAKNFLFSKGVVEAWMKSPTHRENIMRKEYTEIGFAVMNGTINGEETTLVVQMFGKPLTTVANAPQTQQPQIAVKPARETQPQIVVNQPESVLAKNAQQKPALIPFYFNLNIVFFTFLFLALILDFYFATKLKIIRISGKNIAHALFIGFITVGLFIMANGKII